MWIFVSCDCIGLRFVHWIAGRMWASKYETKMVLVLSERPSYILVSFSLGPSFFGFRLPYQRPYCVNTFSFPRCYIKTMSPSELNLFQFE